jgi:hypothetical protein
MINLAAIFYLMVALFFLNRILKYYQVPDKYRAIVLTAITFGTNIFYYTVVESGMSHIYSLAFFSAFIHFTILFFENKKTKYIYILAAITGMIILIRPVNGIILFSTPFLAQNKKQFISGLSFLLRHKTTLILSLVIGLSIPFIQLILYKISTGSFFVYSYINEGFDFLDPHMFDFLFSYKKGLFLYTPLLLIGLFGIYYFWKQSRFKYYSYLLFIILVIYVLSSWTNWWYGGSFSSRAFLEYIPFVAIPMGTMLQQIKTKGQRIIFIGLITIFIVFCQIQTYQYRYYQIHWEDMTKEKYWDVFLRIDRLMK